MHAGLSDAAIGATFDGIVPNPANGRVDATWTITDVARNVAVGKGTIRAK